MLHLLVGSVSSLGLGALRCAAAAVARVHAKVGAVVACVRQRLNQVPLVGATLVGRVTADRERSQLRRIVVRLVPKVSPSFPEHVGRRQMRNSVTVFDDAEEWDGPEPRGEGRGKLPVGNSRLAIGVQPREREVEAELVSREHAHRATERVADNAQRAVAAAELNSPPVGEESAVNLATVTIGVVGREEVKVLDPVECRAAPTDRDDAARILTSDDRDDVQLLHLDHARLLDFGHGAREAAAPIGNRRRCTG
eukprot:4147210-Prymnesium_polylepis.1